MKNKALIISTGLAMFSMFFGSGNLVFPLLVGKLSEGHVGFAFLGIVLTGVLVPFLGVFALFLFQGNTQEFFGRLGKGATFWLPLIALSLMGPFGVLARCITVAHGAFKLLLPDSSIEMFSIISCSVLFILSLRKGKIVSLLGSKLTPLLLISLALIAIFGIYSTDFPVPAKIGAWNGFKEGILQGYQTMDLLAAFFFSAFVIQQLKGPKEESLSTFLKASFLGVSLLSIIYFFLVLLGAMYAPELVGVPPEEMLGTIAHRALGPFGAFAVVSAVILACLTTAIVLTSLFADFLRKEVTKERIGPSLSLLITLAIAYFISTLEFSGIMSFIGPILTVSYPALITLTVMSILYKLYGYRSVRMPFAVVFFLKLFGAI